MDSRLSTTLLPLVWVIETLARSNQIDVSLLLDLLEKFPKTSDDLGRNARELVSFRILETFLFQGAQSNSLASSTPKIAFDQSESCEDVLQRILLETPASSLKAGGPEMWKWDIQAFVALKRSTLDKHALQQLKDAILTGSHSFLASLKEQRGLPLGNQPGSGFLVNGGKPDGTMRRSKGGSSPRISKSDYQLVSPAVVNSSYLMHNDKPNEILLPVKQKGHSITIISSAKSGEDQIISKDGIEGHKEVSKKYENDIIHCEQYLGGKLSSSIVNRHSVDTSMVIGQYSNIERCGLERSANFRGPGADGPPEDDISECTLKDMGGANEVLNCKNQAPHSDIELPNDKSDDEHAQNIVTREAKSNKERSESQIKDYVQIGEEGKIQDLHCDTELPNDKYDKKHGQNEIGEEESDKESFCDLNSTAERDKSEPHSKDYVRSEREEGINIGCAGQCKYSRSATNCSDLNMLPNVCAGVDEVSQNRTCLVSMGQNGHPGDVDSTSSKGLLGHDKVMHHKKQACDDNTKLDHENGNAGNCESFREPITSGGCKDGFEQEIHRNMTDLGHSEDFVCGDSDGCLDERTDIATKKNAFLSSQCSFSQGAFDCRELNVCVKCNKGGKLMVCSANSCRLVVHEICLGSHVSFSTKGEFHCPFCAYSQAISEYMDIKKRVSLTRKDFATFVCLEAKKELKKQPHRSYRRKQHHFEHDDGLDRSNKPNNQDKARCITNRKRRRKLEYEEAGWSTLSSGDNSPSGGKTVDSINGKAHPSKKYKREMKKMRQTPQSTRAHGQREIAALAILRSKGDNASNKDPGKSHRSKSPVVIRSKNRVIHSPDSHIVSEGKISPHNVSADCQERSEENDNSRAPKYSTRVPKQQKQYTYQEIPQLRRKRVPWTTEEEEKLKEGMRKFYNPRKTKIPWKEILEFGSTVFDGRSTIDLKDKWRNLCRNSPSL